MMMTITRNVRDIDTVGRLALEHVLGAPLREDQQVVITIQPASKAPLPSWLNLYEGMTDEEIADVETAILERDRTSRSLD
jgi:hypothetical protein